MTPIPKLQRMTLRYELADGVRELQQAVWLLMMGVYVWLLWDMPRLWTPLFDSAKSQGSAMILLVVLVVFGLPIAAMQGVLRFMNMHIRRRWLWRNTGVVRPKAWIIPRRVLFTSYGVMLAVFLLVTWVAVQREDLWLIVRALYLATGAGLCWMGLWTGRLFDLPRYTLSAAVGGAGTLVILVLPVSLGTAALLMGVLWAGTLTVSGLYAMRAFNRLQEMTDAA